MVWFPVLLIVIIILARGLSLPPLQPWTTNLETMQTVLTVCAISFGIGWYFFERPDAAKVELAQKIHAFGILNDYVLIIDEVSIKNVGGTSIQFDQEPFAIFFEQITPITSKPWREYVDRNSKNLVSEIYPSINWNLLAGVIGGNYSRIGIEYRKFRRENGMSGVIESGETDNFYYRSIIKCKPQLRISISARYEKPYNWYENILDYFGKANRLVWVKQDISDLTTICRQEEAMKSSIHVLTAIGITLACCGKKPATTDNSTTSTTEATAPAADAMAPAAPAADAATADAMAPAADAAESMDSATAQPPPLNPGTDSEVATSPGQNVPK